MKKKIILIAFGVFLSLLSLELLLRGAGALYLARNLTRNDPAADDKTYRILCIGDSMTALGEENSYPAQLAELLNSRGRGRLFTVLNRGVPGSTASSIMKRLPFELKLYRPQMVICMMGINDSGSGVPGLRGRCAAALKELRVYKLFSLIADALRRETVKALYWQSGKMFMDQEEFELAEIAFKRAIELFPGDWYNYYQLGACENLLGHSLFAQRVLRKALELNPAGQEIAIELGIAYMDRGEFEDADRVFTLAQTLDPRTHDVYDWMCANALLAHDETRAQDALKQFIANNPDDRHGYWAMAIFLKKLGNPDALNLFAKAAEKEGGYADALCAYGEELLEQKRYTESLAVFERSIAADSRVKDGYLGKARSLDYLGRGQEAEEVIAICARRFPRRSEVFVETGKFFLESGRYSLAESYLLRALALNRGRYGEYSDTAFNALIALYTRTGENAKREAAEQQGKALRERDIRSKYNRLRDVLSARGIKFVCMSYPTRSVQGLKEYFLHPGGIVFVDNGGLFKEAVAREGFAAIFCDEFAVDFGHCTPKGNGLLAGNIARTLAREVFKDETKF